MMIRIKLVFLCFLALACLFSCKEPSTRKSSPPVFTEPAFSISSISVLQAELINTRLKVRICIDNSNGFPIDLSSFEYKLYGGGRFWAEGKETQVLTIQAHGSGEKDLFLVMNFTNMRRDMLDQIIAMKRVQYRLTGTALIEPALEGFSFPPYTARFNLEGESDVEQ